MRTDFPRSFATADDKLVSSLGGHEEHFRLLVESVVDYAIFMLDPGGRVVSWNRGAERIKGYSAQEIVGRHFSLFYPPEDVASGKPVEELKVAAAAGRFEDEGWRLRRDGSCFWANVVITALRGEGGELRGFAKVTRDISERKQTEERLREKNLELENAAESKNRFLANMSHELRTPLNGIIGFAEFLHDGKPGPLNAKQKEYLDDILNSGRHLLQLVNDVLDLAKVEANKLTLRPERFDLREAVAGICAVAHPIAHKKRIEIDVVIDRGIRHVFLDPQKFKQILYNLMANALKFTDEGGKVGVVVKPFGNDRFRVAVRDSGIGIRREDFPRLFTEFEQLDAGSARRYEGTGLGLALTRRIVELQGGAIAVESEPGCGSTFTVDLPIESTEELL
jgi:protein-histidine pros-kinase